MKKLIQSAVKIANRLDMLGASEEADAIEMLVQKAAEALPPPPDAKPQIPAGELLSLVKEMRDQAAKEIEYGKQNPQEAEEENKEAAKMNAWADKIVNLFGLQEEKKEEPKEEEVSDQE